jgi:hypothetical protein
LYNVRGMRRLRRSMVRTRSGRIRWTAYPLKVLGYISDL